MKVIFYSDKCEYSIKILAYLNKYNIENMFKLVNINTSEYPKEIDSVPTIIDTDLSQPIKGKKALEYLMNIRYFNNPTNNVEYIKDLPTNPSIPEDNMAFKAKSMDLEIKENESVQFVEKTKDTTVNTSTQEMVQARQVQDRKLSVLLRLRGNGN